MSAESGLFASGPDNLAGGYSQIPLNKQSPFPLGELGAGGGYDRLIYLPDDIIPTLNLGFTWQYQTDAPHLLRSQSDGSLRVYDTSPTPSGSGPPKVVRVISGRNTVRAYNTVELVLFGGANNGGNTLVGFDLTFTVEATPASDGDVTVWITDRTDSNLQSILNQAAGPAAAAGTAFHPQVMFPGGLDVLTVGGWSGGWGMAITNQIPSIAIRFDYNAYIAA